MNGPGINNMKKNLLKNKAGKYGWKANWIKEVYSNSYYQNDQCNV